MTRVVPAQRPGKSEQEVCTPRELLDAIERRFGPIRWDLAATAENSVAGPDRFFGPGSKHDENSLSDLADWSAIGGVLWLNPPFGDIAPFAAKAAYEGPRGARVTMLVPAAVSTEWWRSFVHGKAFVLFLRPRVVFVGHKAGFPKDLAMCCWGPWTPPGYVTWKWNHPTEVAAP